MTEIMICSSTKILHRALRSCRLFHSSCVVREDQRWRQNKGLTKHQSQSPELYSLPDYSFLDGRPTPISRRHFALKEQNKMLVKHAVRLLGEVDYAVKKYDSLTEEEKLNRKKFLEGKLKRKGVEKI